MAANIKEMVKHSMENRIHQKQDKFRTYEEQAVLTTMKQTTTTKNVVQLKESPTV